VNATLKNELQFNAEWRDQRTLTLNSAAGQIVEATTRGLTEEYMGQIAEMIDSVLSHADNPAGIAAVREKVNELMGERPIFAWD
jgi:hypothetical protein